LPWIASEEGVLADVSVILFDVYRATVMWEARERAVEIQGAETSALLGMAMLENHDVSMRVRPGGQVRIQLGS
jgi:hypothetical protein